MPSNAACNAAREGPKRYTSSARCDSSNVYTDETMKRTTAIDHNARMRFGWVKGGRRRGSFPGFSLFSFLRRPFVRVHVYRRVRIRSARLSMVTVSVSVTVSEEQSDQNASGSHFRK